MRGHWTSQTRRLNKHYQNGDGGIIPRPDFSWGKYMTGGSYVPYLFMHDPDYESRNPDQRYYNRMFNSISSQYDQPYGNVDPTSEFARAYCWQGPVSKKYDGLYVSMRPDYVVYPDSHGHNWQGLYNELVSKRMRPIYDPDFYNADSKYLPGDQMHSASTYYDAGTLSPWYGLGIRYVKFHLPSFSWSPGYYYGDYEENGVFSKCKGKSEVIESDIRLSSRACTEFASIATRHQYASFAMTYMGDLVTNVVGDPWVVSLSIPDDDMLGLAELENMSQSYLEDTVTFYIKPIDPDHQFTYKVRVYLFLWDGEYYVDQWVHFFDPVTDEEVQIPGLIPFLYSLKFPSVLMGDCYGREYYQDQTDPCETYPSWMPYATPVTYSYDPDYESGIAKRLFTSEQIADVMDDQVYGEDNTIRLGPMRLTRLRMIEVDEQTFWEKEGYWHEEYGGSPYEIPT